MCGTGAQSILQTRAGDEHQPQDDKVEDEVDEDEDAAQQLKKEEAKQEQDARKQDHTRDAGAGHGSAHSAVLITKRGSHGLCCSGCILLAENGGFADLVDRRRLSGARGEVENGQAEFNE